MKQENLPYIILLSWLCMVDEDTSRYNKYKPWEQPRV